VPVLPGFEPAFDERFLAEYLYCRRTFGTKTPITGLEQLPPATILTCDIEAATPIAVATGSPDTGPKTDRSRTSCGNSPTDSNGRSTTRRETTATTASCWWRERLSAVLAAADEPLTAFHLGDGWNREARIAKRAADAADSRFELLNRGPNYHATLLGGPDRFRSSSGRFTRVTHSGSPMKSTPRSTRC